MSQNCLTYDSKGVLWKKIKNIQHTSDDLSGSKNLQPLNLLKIKIAHSLEIDV